MVGYVDEVLWPWRTGRGLCEGRYCGLCSCHMWCDSAARSWKAGWGEDRWVSGITHTPWVKDHPGTGHPHERITCKIDIRVMFDKKLWTGEQYLHLFGIEIKDMVNLIYFLMEEHVNDKILLTPCQQRAAVNHYRWSTHEAEFMIICEPTWWCNVSFSVCVRAWVKMQHYHFKA